MDTSFKRLIQVIFPGFGTSLSWAIPTRALPLLLLLGELDSAAGGALYGGRGGDFSTPASSSSSCACVVCGYTYRQSTPKQTEEKW